MVVYLRKVHKQAAMCFVLKTQNRRCLPVTVIVELIVTAKGRQSPLTNPKREKHLCTCIHPHLRGHNTHISNVSQLKKCWNTNKNVMYGSLWPERKSSCWLSCWMFDFITYLRVHQPCGIRVQVEWEAIFSSRQRQATSQQNHQHHVGEGGCEINYLATQETGRAQPCRLLQKAAAGERSRWRTALAKVHTSKTQAFSLCS